LLERIANTEVIHRDSEISNFNRSNIFLGFSCLAMGHLRSWKQKWLFCHNRWWLLRERASNLWLFQQEQKRTPEKNPLRLRLWQVRYSD